MSTPQSLRARVDRFLRRWIDTLTYVSVIVTLSIVGALVLSIATGGELARANVFLFITGWGVLAYATFLMWPSSPDDLDDSTESGQTVAESTKLQSVARELPPARWIDLPQPQHRMPPRQQLFVAAILVLTLSFVAENWLGIG